jgi:hypothetical protein
MGILYGGDRQLLPVVLSRSMLLTTPSPEQRAPCYDSLRSKVNCCSTSQIKKTQDPLASLPRPVRSRQRLNFSKTQSLQPVPAQAVIYSDATREGEVRGTARSGARACTSFRPLQSLELFAPARSKIPSVKAAARKTKSTGRSTRRHPNPPHLRRPYATVMISLCKVRQDVCRERYSGTTKRGMNITVQKQRRR